MKDDVATLTSLAMVCLPFFFLAIKLDVKNIVNVLREAQFSDGHWEQLGQQLIDHPNLITIGASRQHNSSLCMSDTISHWLNNDSKASWEKLAEAVSKVGGYGETAAAIVLQKAGICMFCLMSVFCEECS